MRSRGIWLTVLMRGCKLNSLTPSNGGTTAPISYTQCYKSGGGHRSFEFTESIHRHLRITC
jgi:hypothetical protein